MKVQVAVMVQNDLTDGISLFGGLRFPVQNPATSIKKVVEKGVMPLGT